jgi:hypothetical protein
MKGKLGLVPMAESQPGMAYYPCGTGTLFVYQSEFAGTNKATAVTWVVGEDIIAIARELAAKGVVFENYDVPNAQKDGDVYLFGAIRTAWFKDPDGNIHALVT